MTAPPPIDPQDESGALLVSSTSRPPVVLEEGPSGVVTCSERLPRDVLVRLAALSRQIADLRRDHAAHRELSLRLDDVAADLHGLIQSIHDETVRHLAGRRG